MHRCPNCGAINRGHASICPECGENLRTKPRKIRCRQCGKSASSVLVICPHCGRELEAAPTRLLVWGLPLLLALTLVFLLISRWNALRPLGWAQAQIDAGLGLFSDLTDSLDPGVSIEMTPVIPTPTAVAEPVATALPGAASDSANAAAPVAAQGDSAGQTSEPITEVQTVSMSTFVTPTTPSTNQPTPLPTEPAPPTEAPTFSPTATATATDTATPAPTATDPPTVQPTATNTNAPTATPAATRQALVLLPTPTPTLAITLPTIAAVEQPLAPASRANSERSTGRATATPTSSATATATSSPLPTATATPSPTPTPVPQVTYEVRAGDTLSAIASRTNVSVEALMAANNLTAQDVYTLRPGDQLIIPTAGSATAQAAAPTVAAPTAPPRTYTVQPGDIPFAIANRFGVSVDALLAANGLTRDDARSLRSGQVLVIPGPGQPGAATTTVTTAANPVAPANSPLAVRLDPPRLRSPENGAQVSCNGGGTLAWEAVNFMQPGDEFLMHLGFVSSIGADGRETIVWVLEQVQASTNTIWRMDPNLCGLAPQDLGRKWYWYVEVIQQSNGNRVRISPPSPTWAFFWN